MNKKVLYPVIALVLGLGLAVLIGSDKPELNPQPFEPMPTVVRVLAANVHAEHLTVRSQGTVQPRSQSELIPEVTGIVNWISPSLVSGGAFREGDVLLRIDPRDYQTSLLRAQAKVEQAESTLAQEKGRAQVALLDPIEQGHELDLLVVVQHHHLEFRTSWRGFLEGNTFVSN